MSYQVPTAPPAAQTSQKSFLTTWLLSLLFGVFGIDHFYLGKVGTGVLKLLTLGGLGFWYLIDLIITLTGNQKDKHGRVVEGYQEHKKVALFVSLGVILVWFVIGLLMRYGPGVGSPDKVDESLDEVDVNGLTVSAACEEVRAAGWRVDRVQGDGDYREKSDCSDSGRNVVRAIYYDGTVTLYFANEWYEAEATVEEAPVEESPVEQSPVEEAPVEEAPVEEAPVEEASTVGGTGGYQAIYDEYSARIQNECPTLSMGECAELTNEGVSEMAEYMYRASGTDGQYATYETWAGDLMDVYMSSVQ